MKSTLLTLFTFLLAFSIQAKTVNVRGVVNDSETKSPLEGALVTLDGTRASAVTDGKGAFLFFGVEEGEHTFSVKAEGYSDQSIRVAIESDSEQDFNLGTIELAPEQQESGIVNKEDFIPTITLSDEDLEQESDNQNISGVLSASRDVFVSTAAFTFGSARFRIRGYDSEEAAVYVNGIPFNELENGRVFWSAWGGLNDVVRNRDTEVGLEPVSYTFGGLGGATSIDTRASLQRPEIRLTYSSSNRGYRNRAMATVSSGMMDNGWAVTFSGSHRWADEGYQPGTFYDSWAYFLSVDRKLGDNHMLNLNIFGSPTKRGRAGASTQEVYDLAGSNYYNSFWGYQNGKVRNSRVSNIHQPVVILRHDWKISPEATLTTAASYQFGRIGSSALNWFDAPDPRPDYYRKMPSFFRLSGWDEAADIVEQDLLADPNALQVPWDELYDANRNSQLDEKFSYLLDGQEYTGKWSQYMVEDRRYDTREMNFYSNYQHAITSQFTLSGGISYQAQTVETFKTVEDLLGGDFFLNVDAFAVRDFSDDFDIQQNDLNNPSEIVRQGDVFGYNYDIDVRKGELWMQGQMSLPKLDLFLAGNVSNSQFWRTGKYRTGRFPDNSFGESEKQSFTNIGIKGGATYKLDGRNYLFANAAFLTRAPFVRNAFVSPRTRDQAVRGLDSETIYSGEAGYLLRSPNVKARASAYYTQFENRIDLIQFYNDLSRSFGAFVMTGLNQRHMGAELAVEAKITSSLSATAVAALGQYIYNSRATGYLYEDNSEAFDAEAQGFEVYSKNVYVPGRPQNAYTLGLQYRPRGYWFAYLNFNYFDGVWIDYNPLSRTSEAVLGVDPSSAEFERIIEQKKGDDAFTVDFFGGKSFRFGDIFLYLNLGVNNILNNQDFITGGFDQLRFDFDVRSGDDTVFIPRYYYLYGRTYFVNVSLRF
ncbi:MAG: TonB-dependent receptor [Lewinellaceae bacterium]|nr:TonB-dependent receptor [Phaeodactylibacter sp.]MCB0613557.1 TonB-dependent receptor [Phaeodactylibacter sp.]MCB9349714.1 TonB-dependent receptor [Lewinellaceae bacterium]